MKPTIFYSQNREDLIIHSFFPDIKEGFYVDVGAHHPINDSVTKFFYEKGWHGINIEPQTKLFKLIEEDRDRDTNLNIGIATEKGMLTLRQYKGTGLSTFSEGMKKDYQVSRSKEVTEFKDIEVPVDTLNNVFIKNNIKHIHFLKVDVEGYEFDVLKSNNWAKFKPELICIESNHVIGKWKDYLKKNGYNLEFFDGLNDYYLSTESAHRKELFLEAYPELLVSAPILSEGWRMQIEKLNESIRHKDELIESTRAEVSEYYQKTNSIKYLSKRIIKAIGKKFLTILGLI